MTALSSKNIHKLLIKNLPRDLVLAIEEALAGAAKIAFESTAKSHPGHRANELGNARYFRANEAFFDVLATYGASPTPLHGNGLVVGHAGDFKLARFNVRVGPWYNARRSRKRMALVQGNEYIAELVQGSLFESEEQQVPSGIVFFVMEFGETAAERPLDILIAVPAPGMKSWLYCESISTFVQGYSEPSHQDDVAKPVLKASVKKRKDNEGGTT
ncbi:alpha/beta hydrolase [Zoogloea sp. LCSB751]|uniref:alpha/beta hydrolase n=1 Tax=Zoogloea sp. LCSB751 TaxID=1965277 RepID=UPI001115B4FE|nr:alpha/beta hydrolase [Zoogloea sp. LCSB751]